MMSINNNAEMNYEFPENIEQEIEMFSEVYSYGDKKVIRDRQKDGTWTMKQRKAQWATFVSCIAVSALSVVVFTQSDSSYLINGIICVLSLCVSFHLIRRGIHYLKTLKQIEMHKTREALQIEPKVLWSMILPHPEYEVTKYKLLMIIFETRSLYAMIHDADSEDFGFSTLDERLGFLAKRVIEMNSLKDHSSLAIAGEIFMNRKHAKQLFKLFRPTIEMNFLLLEETMKKE